MLSQIISRFLTYAQGGVLVSAVVIGVVWAIPPLRDLIHSEFGWLDDSALLGALIAGLALLLTLLGKISKRLDALEELSSTLSDVAGRNAFRVIPDDQYGTLERCEYIKSSKPKRTRLIEMSGDTVDRELLLLLENEIPTELLLMHPVAIRFFPRNSCIDGTQLRTSLRNHLDRIKSGRTKRALLPSTDKLKVLYYHTVPGFRGRHLGERIELSWYCFREDQGWPIILGHCNPTVVADTDSVGGQSLLRTFEAAFDAMSTSAVKLDDDEWADAIEKAEEWIKTVK